MSKANSDKAKTEEVNADLDTSTDLPPTVAETISAALNTLLADAFALYLKTKNFHWHVRGRYFRDYHLMLDEQSDAIFATTTSSPNVSASWTAPRCARSGRSANCRPSRTIMRAMCRRARCCAN